MVNIEIGSYEAKTKLPELLRNVQLGSRYTITLRGRPIADLVPPESLQSRDVAAAVSQMHRFIESNEPILGVDTKALIEEGRD
ncbi:prevent-host-death family protein [Oxalobacteraceae bacterium GrIS 2.11]